MSIEFRSDARHERETGLQLLAVVIVEKPTFKGAIERSGDLLQFLFAKIVALEFAAEVLRGATEPGGEFFDRYIPLNQGDADFLCHGHDEASFAFYIIKQTENKINKWLLK